MGIPDADLNQKTPEILNFRDFIVNNEIYLISFLRVKHKGFHL